MKVLWYHSLRTKILVTLIPLLGLSMGLALFWISRYQKQFFIKSGITETTKISEIIKSSLKYQMLNHEGGAVQKSIEEIQRANQSLNRLWIINKEGS